MFHFGLHSVVFLLLRLGGAATGHAVPEYSPEDDAKGYKTGKNLVCDL